MINDKAVKAVFQGSMRLKRGESCLIVTDTIKEDIGLAFYDYATANTNKARILVIQPAAEHGNEPPEEAALQMLDYDVQILVTDKSLTHTCARREATKRGARIATMPSITEEIANRCLDVDYEKLRGVSMRLSALLEGSSNISVRTAVGTDISFVPGGNFFFGKEGGIFDAPGSFGNLPEGEISFSPETCEGKYVVDASFPGLGLLEDPLIFTVTAGKVVDIKGAMAPEVIRRLDAAGEKAYIVAELGIGLNPKARIIGNILEDEKVIGTVHIAVGNNLSYGGDNDVSLHLDGVIKTPDITVDGEKIMEKGIFLRQDLDPSRS